MKPQAQDRKLNEQNRRARPTARRFCGGMWNKTSATATGRAAEAAERRGGTPSLDNI